MFTPVLASGKCVGELIFLIGINAKKSKILCGTDRIHLKPYKITKCARKSIQYDVGQGKPYLRDE